MRVIITIAIIFFFFINSVAALSQSTFAPQTLENAIINYVKKENKCESSIEIAQTIKPLRFQQSGVNANISHTDNLLGNCKVLLSFYDGNTLIHSESIRLNVKAFATVPVAKHFIAKDKEIDKNDIVMQKVEVTNIDPNSVAYISDAVGKASKNGIAKGKVIQYTDLSTNNNVLIKKGDKVNLLHYRGAFLIKTEVVAIEGGSPGSRIKVKRGHQTLYGFVADDGNVILETDTRNNLTKQ